VSVAAHTATRLVMSFLTSIALLLAVRRSGAFDHFVGPFPARGKGIPLVLQQF
jgi:hypothetical protein